MCVCVCVCVSVLRGMQSGLSYGLYGSSIFFHIINGKDVGGKIIEHKMFAFIFSTNFV